MVRSYALVGASSRSLAYGLPLSKEYADRARLAGVFDPNPVRAGAVAELCGGADVFTDFDAMLQTARPDCVIITTVDRYHAEYIVRALEAGHVDGYHRDGCVFSPEIDIYDTMSVAVRYRSGALLSYSLIAHSPYEGWRAAINGEDGRLELEEFHSGGRVAEAEHLLHLYNRRGDRITYAVPKTAGVHGGGDERLVARLFGGRPLPDPLGLMADSWAGARSVLIGAAANQSIASGQPVRIGELLAEQHLT